MTTAEHAKEISIRYKTLEGITSQTERPEYLEIMRLFRKMVEQGINEASVNGKRVYRLSYPLPKTEIKYWREKGNFKVRRSKLFLRTVFRW